jgi:Lrp/AsnC family transcriptional regulator for asnA, asnC and gidA
LNSTSVSPASAAAAPGCDVVVAELIAEGPSRDGNQRISFAAGMSTSDIAPDGGRNAGIRTSPPPPLDEANRRIIEILQRDGRSPFSAIGRELGLSETAVRTRVHRLMDAGVLDVVAVTNPLKLGFDVMAIVGVQAQADLDRVAREVSEWSETSYVVLTSGSYDLLVEVVCEDNRHLLDTVQRMREIDGVKSTETFMYLDMVKMTYAWGTRP